MQRPSQNLNSWKLNRMRKKRFLLLALLGITLSAGMNAQERQQPSIGEMATLPTWMQMMYCANPNVFEADHDNVHALAQCAGTPSMMYAGTEPGVVSRSRDGGTAGVGISQSTLLDGGLSSLAVDRNIAVLGSGWKMRRTRNAGSTWTTALHPTNLCPNEIQFHPNLSNVVSSATDTGTPFYFNSERS